MQHQYLMVIYLLIYPQKQLILYDIVQTVVQHQQSFIFQNIYKILLFWTMNTQYLSMLNMFQSWTPKCRKLFLLHCPKDFIGFISECIVNMLRGQLDDLKKTDVQKYQKEIKKLARKRTPLHERRKILSSTKGLNLIATITKSIIVKLSWNGTVCSHSAIFVRGKIPTW